MDAKGIGSIGMIRMHPSLFNTLRLRQKLAAILQLLELIFLNENHHIGIWNSLKLVSNIPINIKTALVLKMVWCQTGNKPLSESMMD